LTLCKRQKKFSWLVARPYYAEQGFSNNYWKELQVLHFLAMFATQKCAIFSYAITLLRVYTTHADFSVRL
jgi:hypothetical protein